MWIEYDLKFKEGCREIGMFNTDQIKWIEIKQHASEYGNAIRLFYESYNSKYIFISNEQDALAKVWIALQNAIANIPSSITGIGYIRPVSRPFLNDSTIIPRTVDDDNPC